MSTTTRVAGLAHANTLLLVRNRMTLLYAVGFPLLPMAFLPLASNEDPVAGLRAVTTCLLLAWLFPVFYNLLSMVVTRRDELVLKRLRTGETRDGELLVAMAMPGTVIAVIVSVALIPVGATLGLSLPTNPLLYLLTVLCGTAVFSAFALWTAAWTRTAESAQLTSLPVCVLAVIGQVASGAPEPLAAILERTPGAALTRLVEVTWFAGPDGELSFAQTWSASAEPMLVLIGWAAAAVWLGLRSMRWEPRS